MNSPYEQRIPRAAQQEFDNLVDTMCQIVEIDTQRLTKYPNFFSPNTEKILAELSKESADENGELVATIVGKLLTNHPVEIGVDIEGKVFPARGVEYSQEQCMFVVAVPTRGNNQQGDNAFDHIPLESPLQLRCIPRPQFSSF